MAYSVPVAHPLVHLLFVVETAIAGKICLLCGCMTHRFQLDMIFGIVLYWHL